MEQVLAVDIGGTKLAVGVVDSSGNLVDRVSKATPTDATDAELFEAVLSLVDHFGPFTKYLACGVGCGGPMSAGGELVSPLNIPAWRSFPLAAGLEAHTGLATRVDNDAKALALAEGWVGAAVGERNYMGMVVSTGVGGGIVLDGRLLEGATGNAGHIGQTIVAVPGRPLPAHITGVLEAEASGTAIAFHTGNPPAEATRDVKVATGRFVGQAAGSVANLLDLPLVVVAGSVALGYGDTFFEAAQAEVDRICQLEYSTGTVIRAAGCGDEGPLLGAAAVGLRHIGRQIGAVI